MEQNNSRSAGRHQELNCPPRFDRFFGSSCIPQSPKILRASREPARERRRRLQLSGGRYAVVIAIIALIYDHQVTNGLERYGVTNAGRRERKPFLSERNWQRSLTLSLGYPTNNRRRTAGDQNPSPPSEFTILLLLFQLDQRSSTQSALLSVPCL